RVPTRLPDTLNPNINFETLPFELQSQLTVWQAPEVDGKAVPRRAGISGYGAGGINAHLVVEEYRTQDGHGEDDSPVTFVLSAQTVERLEANVAQWRLWLAERASIPLARIAGTLQLGRDAMPARLSVHVKNREVLLRALDYWQLQVSEGRACGETVVTPEGLSVYWGNTRESRAVDEAAVKAAQIAADGEKLGALWAVGNRVDWLCLYPSGRPHKVPGLPLYPFRRKRCWPVSEMTETLTADKTRLASLPEAGQIQHDVEKNVVENNLVVNDVVKRHVSSADLEKTEQRLLAIFSDVLGLDEGEIREVGTFSELGLTSVNAMHILNAINRTFNRHFPSSMVFEFNTFNALAAYISKQLPADS
ncbi:phosphopantetheine-binding protein, partial [Photorhabdus sp. RM71S]|uniref:acyl carrier protein n=1 Tax=Photorhabdus sp. RM71S TaxID=3342824 RepID=UPI0036DEE81F